MPQPSQSPETIAQLEQVNRLLTLAIKYLIPLTHKTACANPAMHALDKQVRAIRAEITKDSQVRSILDSAQTDTLRRANESTSQYLARLIFNK